jgi:hypothetical protein
MNFQIKNCPNLLIECEVTFIVADSPFVGNMYLSELPGVILYARQMLAVQNNE